MQTIESLSRHIETAQELLSIVSTMKTIAAVSIRQYDQAVQSLVGYRQTLSLGLQAMLINFSEELTRFKPPVSHGLGIVVFGSDQGMCGRFNEQLSAFVQQRLSTEEGSAMDWRVLAIGDRIAQGLTEAGITIEDCLPIPGSIDGITGRVQEIVLHLEHWQRDRQVETILIFYNRPQGETNYAPHMRHLFPLDFSRLHKLRQRPWPCRCRPLVNGPPDRLLSALFHQHFFVGLYQACAESLASENASRLMAMQVAEKNIHERLLSLKFTFQQQRQATITEELLDIIGGFEALQS